MENSKQASKGYHPKFKKKCSIRTWWYTPVVPAFRWLKQEDGPLSISLGYLVSLRPGKAT